MLQPTFKLEYNKKDITKDISDYVLNINYTDVEHGQSDEVEIIFEDSQKLWQDAWIPSKGDNIRLYIGYVGEKLLNCGVFEIDEIEFSTPPDILIVKAIATGITKSLRQNNSVAYENKNLKQIANEIANVFSNEVQQIYNIKNVHVVDNAEPDNSPSNVHHTKDVLIFAILGLVVSIGYVLIVNMLDTTIKTEDDVEKQFNVPVLVSIPAYDFNTNKKGGKKQWQSRRN